MHRSSLALLATVTGMSLYSSCALADRNQDILNDAAPAVTQESQDVNVSIGLGEINSTRYIGSNQRRYRMVPTVNAVWQNGWFAGFPRGVGYNFSADRSVEYGLKITMDMGRKHNVSPALAGLGNINSRPELGGFYSYSPSMETRLNTDIRYGSGNDRKGVLLDVGASYKLALASDRYATFGVSTTYANSSYMQTYFGVNPAQSARSGYAIYTPGAGIREVDLTANYTYKMDRHWSFTTGATLGRLGAAVTAAPMSRSSNHHSLHLLASYTF